VSDANDGVAPWTDADIQWRRDHKCDLRWLATLDAERAKVTRLEKFAAEIDRIRNNIIGKQGVNWSRDIYPLVAALGEAGYEGAGYDEAREAIKRLIAEEQTERAKVEALVRAARADIARYRDDYPNGTRFAATEIVLAGYPDQAGRDAKRGEE
jgi:hypothetical protein